MKRQLRTVLCSSVALAAMAANVPVIAQEITSSIRGSVIDMNGAPVSGVTVTVTHADSGSSRNFTTSSDGSFLARGLRPGGPYTVVVAATSNTNAQTIEGISLTVNQPLALDIPVSALGASVEEIEVTARRLANTLRGGGSSSYGVERLEEVATIGRDFKDAVRQNAFVSFDDNGGNGQLSFGGANSRFNSITLDGIGQDDSFGLNVSGVPTTRSPVSIETIEQIGVAAAPFDVEFGGFTGGQLNIVTKSGTNEFHGSGFYQYRDAGMAGDKSGNGDDDPTNDAVDLGEFEEKYYGGTLGGPIVKDKLFFFASYEKFKGNSPNTFGPEGSGAAVEVPGVTVADVDRVTQIAQDVYGFDTQGYNADSIPLTDEKIFLKLDWNINDDHRAFISYQKNKGNRLSVQDTSVNNQDFGMVSHWYDRTEDVEGVNFQLYSDWSDRLSTEVKIGWIKQETAQVSLSEPGFAEVRIDTGPGEIFIGTDDSRHANRLSNETWNFKAKASYVAGAHTFTGGYELNSVEVFNVFLQRSLGVWYFDSIDDFENGVSSRFDYQNAITGNPDDAAASFTISKHSVYLQDRIDVSDRLVLTGGVRIDYYKQGEEPVLNANFVTRNGFENTATIDGEMLIQPRLSFTYDIDAKTLFRGGIGLFGGGDPNVWLANSFSQDGVTIDTYSTRNDASVLENVDFRNIPVAAAAALTAGDGDVAALDPDYNIPSVWKLNMAVERYFDFGPIGNDWHLTAEAIWSRTKDASDWYEGRRTQIGTAIDGTPIYSSQSGSDIIMRNTGKGKSDQYVFAFDKAYDNGLSVFGSYTYTNAKAVVDGGNFTASSSFNFPAFGDRNNRELGTSNFERRHQIKLGMTYRKQIWDDNDTIVSLFYSGRSGKPFSLTFRDFDEQWGGSFIVDSGASHLIYVPEAGETGVTFESAEDEADFNALVEAYGLKRGELSPKNGHRGPWVNDMDLRISQEVPVASFGKVELWLDMQNVLNFIDSDWGRFDDANFSELAVVDVTVNPDGSYTYGTVRNPEDSFNFQPTSSVWRIQLGAKFKF